MHPLSTAAWQQLASAAVAVWLMAPRRVDTMREEYFMVLVDVLR